MHLETLQVRGRSLNLLSNTKLHLELGTILRQKSNRIQIPFTSFLGYSFNPNLTSFFDTRLAFSNLIDVLFRSTKQHVARSRIGSKYLTSFLNTQFHAIGLMFLFAQQWFLF